MNTNPDQGFGGFLTWVQRLMVQVSYDTLLFNFPVNDSFITGGDAAVFYYKSAWKATVELWRPRGPPLRFILTTTLVHRCGSPHGAELTCDPRAKKKKKLSRFYFSDTINQTLVQ